jgi:predicted metal-dependent hydrolase
MPEETGFLRAVGEFNGGRYFECHDTLEALWVESSGGEKTFLQGMIQVSVGFYHYINGNPGGALSLWNRGAEKLSAFAPVHAGIHIGRLLGVVREWSGAAVSVLSGGPDTASNMQRPTLEFINNSLRREPWPQ